MANALARAVRRRVLSPEDAGHGMQQLEILAVSGPRIEIDPGVSSVRQAFGVARKHQISAYDGRYLELALREQLPLATLDKALRTAAQKAGVKLLR
jgi:predicted nucleic acid-binding protein